MIRKSFLGFLLCFSSVFQSFGQELKLFKIHDFDLNGNVKKCTVITNYGKEVFEFNEEGYLTKSITAYNDTDQDVTTYTYKNGFLAEKRLESYKSNVLDQESSMANFYIIDSTKQKIIKEQIISYDKAFFEEQEYLFEKEDRLSRITTSHENAVDETRIEYNSYKNETTKTYFLNDIIEKSIRNSINKLKSGEQNRIVLTKEYLDGKPNKAIEQRYNNDEKLIYEELFLNTGSEDNFTSQETHLYEYDKEGIIVKEIIKQGDKTSEKEFIFQFDGNEPKNWVKKIIAPENTYTTRKIEYYPKLELIENPK